MPPTKGRKRTPKPIFQYRGPAYVRPIGRGIVLGLGTDYEIHLEDAVDEGDVEIEVKMWRKKAKRQPK